MNRLKATNSVPFANRDVAPGSGTPQWATNGTPGGLPSTIWPAYMFNMMQDEIMNVILAAGLTPDDSNWAQLLAALRTLFKGQNILTIGGSTTWTVPAGVTKVRATVVGGGGAGTGYSSNTTVAVMSGAGGGAGGAAIGILSVTPAQVITVTVGTGGVPNGGSGNASSFGGLIATGGHGGTVNGLSAAGGVGGVGSGGQINLNGGDGCDGQNGTTIKDGSGGASMFGGGGRSGSSTGTNGQAFGSGGGGGYSDGIVPSGNGGPGAQGIVILEW
jgi:hypothetical protein